MTSLRSQEPFTILNSYFYHQIADQFDSTRNAPWNGWKQVLAYISDTDTILDIGCGNGRLLEYLNTNKTDISYLGTDVSQELIDIAQKKYPNARFVVCDALNSFETKKPLDVVCIFGVIHHIASIAYLKQLLDLAYHNSSTVIFTRWNCIVNKTLMTRRIDTSTPEAAEFLSQFGIEPMVFDSHDYLLDWKNTPGALRYVRYWSDEELLPLFDTLGFRIVDTWLSDGTTDSDNTYFVLKHKDLSIRSHVHVVD